MEIENAYGHLVKSGHLCPDGGQKNALIALEALTTALLTPPRRRLFGKRPPPPKGVYLWGPVGSGKSMLMDMFVGQLGDIACKRTHFHDFMAEFHTCRHSAHHISIERAARRMTHGLRILCFDEFTITHIADAMVIKRTFEEIFDSGISVVATSNLAPEDLYAGGLNAERFQTFIPLLRERATVVAVTAARDYRRGKALSLWFQGTDANSALERLWLEMTGGRKAEHSEIRVFGRNLPIPACVDGHVRFSLDALCGRPLGASDYLALADRFHMFFIGDIPLLTPELSAVAARLSVLIDVLYDKRRALAVSAAAEPDAIFTDRNPVFQRTISRLNEMCSRPYLEATEAARS